MNLRNINLFVCAILLSLTILSMAPASASPLEKQGTAYYGSYDTITVGTWSAAKDLSFKVSANASIDVYLLTSDEYLNYVSSATFTPLKAVENTMNSEFKVRSTINTNYILVIDNVDNGRTGDAIPKGDVSYTATYPDFMDQTTDTVTNFFNTCILSAVLAVVVVVVIIVLVIYFMVRKKPEPQQPVVMVPVQQYAPPPQAPVGPAAPPLSPYEPPPPDYQPPSQGQQQYPPNPPQY